MKKPIYGSLLFFMFVLAFLHQYLPFQNIIGQVYTASENSTTNSGYQNSTNKYASPIIYQTFSDNFNLNDHNNWRNAFGNWTYIPYGLKGGIDGKIISLINNTLLSPTISTNNSIITTSFKVNNLDSNVSNYASIVNSFFNPNNYQQAGINIYNGDVYILFSKFVNGTQINYPEWPGIKTDLKWIPGTIYTMSLVTRGHSQDLIINGTKYVSHNDNTIDSNGYAGLSYGRMKDIVFYNFELQNYNNSRMLQ